MGSGRLLRVLVGIIVLSSGLVVSSVVWAQVTDTVLETDIVYLTRGDTKLLLDIARPAAQKGKCPALLFVHGWAPGYDKSQHRSDILLAPARGYVGVAMSYRLPPVFGAAGQAAVFPEPICDVKSAVRWLRAHADGYGIDPDRIGVVGFSFGAYLALMVAFTAPSDGFEDDAGLTAVSSKVQVAVAAGPVVDWNLIMRETTSAFADNRRLTGLFFGGLPDEVPERYRDSRPARYMGYGDAPVLAVFGGWDLTIGQEQAHVLEEAMLNGGARGSFLWVPRASHSFQELATPNMDYPMWSFLDSYLKAK